MVENTLNNNMAKIAAHLESMAGGPEVKQEFDYFGKHRLVVSGIPGEWFVYTQPSISHCGQYMGFTQYFSGLGKGWPLVERVVKIQDVKFKDGGVAPR